MIWPKAAYHNIIEFSTTDITFGSAAYHAEIEDRNQPARIENTDKLLREVLGLQGVPVNSQPTEEELQSLSRQATLRLGHIITTGDERTYFAPVIHQRRRIIYGNQGISWSLSTDQKRVFIRRTMRETTKEEMQETLLEQIATFEEYGIIPKMGSHERLSEFLRC